MTYTSSYSAAAACNEDLNRQSTRYLSFLLSLSTVLVLLVAVINSLIDPFNRFEWWSSRGINLKKPAAIRHVKMAKAYQVERVQPRTLLLGNSRVDIGLNPESPQLGSSRMPAYNMGQPGGGLYWTVRYLEHTLAFCEVETVVVGMDFMDFLKRESETSDAPQFHEMSADERRLAVLPDGQPTPQRWRQQLMDACTSSISLSACVNSVQTVAAQSNPYCGQMTREGFNPGLPFISLIHAEGQSSLFEQKNRDYLDDLREKSLPELHASHNATLLQRLIDLCEQNQVELLLFIHPYHSDVLELFDRTGHWENFENWKRFLCRTCEDVPVPLWDFATYSSVTTEPVPRSDSGHEVMKWYWESGHYRSEVGDLIFAVLFSAFSADEQAADNFGLSLSKDTIESHLERIRELQTDYRQNYSSQAQRVIDLVWSKNCAP